MNTLINTSVLIFLLSTRSFPQFFADSVLSDDIVDFVNIANEIASTEQEFRNPEREFTNEELKHILNLYYKCYSEHLVNFNDYMSEEHKKWDQGMRESNGKSEELRPWMRIYAMVGQLKEEYGTKFISIAGTPAVIRAKYLNLSFSKYHVHDLNTDFRVHNFGFAVEEVLKGDKYFFSGDTISIDMIPNIESPAPSFLPGKSYLIPVTTILGQQEDAFNTIFVYLREQENVMEMGKPPETFPIENEIIKNCGYFGIHDTSWIDFKKYFMDTYLIFN